MPERPSGWSADNRKVSSTSRVSACFQSVSTSFRRKLWLTCPPSGRSTTVLQVRGINFRSESSMRYGEERDDSNGSFATAACLGHASVYDGGRGSCTRTQGGRGEQSREPIGRRRANCPSGARPLGAS